MSKIRVVDWFEKNPKKTVVLMFVAYPAIAGWFLYLAAKELLGVTKDKDSK